MKTPAQMVAEFCARRDESHGWYEVRKADLVNLLKRYERELKAARKSTNPSPQGGTKPGEGR